MYKYIKTTEIPELTFNRKYLHINGLPGRGDCYRSSCYTVILIKDHVANGNAQCNTVKGALVTIETGQEYDFLVGTIMPK